MENQLVKLVNESGLEQSKSQVLLDNFKNYFEIAAEWDAKVNALNVTDVSQIAEMKMAGEARKFLKSKRIDVENTRKTLKEQSLREGQTIDSIAKILKNLIEPIEEKAEKIEKFKELKEEKELNDRLLDRLELLAPFNAAIDSNYFKVMPEDQFKTYLTGLMVEKERKEAEAKRIEEERIAKEKADAEERARVLAENKRLKEEAEAKKIQLAFERKQAEDLAAKEREDANKKLEAERAKAAAEKKLIEDKARKERESAEAILKAEKEKQAKFEAEIKAKQESELAAKKEAAAKVAAEIQAKADAERKAKLAPDKDKLFALIVQIDSLSLPQLTDAKARGVIDNVKTLLNKVTTYINEQANQL